MDGQHKTTKVKLFKYNYKEYFAVFSHGNYTECRFWAVDVEHIEHMYYLGKFENGELFPVDVYALDEYSLRQGSKRLYNYIYKIKSVDKIFKKMVSDRIHKHTPNGGQTKNLALRAECVRLRKEGCTYKQISHKVNRDPALVYRWVKEETEKYPMGH